MSHCDKELPHLLCSFVWHLFPSSLPHFPFFLPQSHGFFSLVVRTSVADWSVAIILHGTAQPCDQVLICCRKIMKDLRLIQWEIAQLKMQGRFSLCRKKNAYKISEDTFHLSHTSLWPELAHVKSWEMNRPHGVLGEGWMLMAHCF